jgi:ABC-type multidrug transport system fused ATPase/permease subunit
VQATSYLDNFKRSWNLLLPSDKKKYFLFATTQAMLGFLDLIGIALLGLLGAISFSGLGTSAPSANVLHVVKFLGLGSLGAEEQILLLALGSCLLLIGKTILNIFLTRKILFFLSRCGATISADLVRRLLGQTLSTIQSRSSQQTLFSVTSGVSLIMLQILANSAVLVADLALLLIMAVGLLTLDPVTAATMGLMFISAAWLLNMFVNVRARKLGTRSSELEIQSSEKIIEVLSSFRETVVRNRRGYYAREVGNTRHQLAKLTAEMNFLPYVNKYVIETMVVLGAVLIGGIQFAINDSSQAISTIVVFLAAGTRVAPALLRVQQGSISIRSAVGQAAPTFDLIASLDSVEIEETVEDELKLNHENFQPLVNMTNVSYKYPGNSRFAVQDVTIKILPGHSVAIVGSSGGGKSTIVDLLLGVLDPIEGEISISGKKPIQAFSIWPGAVAYVPQDATISNTSIRNNLTLGYPASAVDDDQIFEVLTATQLDNFVGEITGGMNSIVGERGNLISGGQRQRLGIARALLTRPKLIVLDEATSALDSETEASIAKSLKNLRGIATVVLVSHRLSMVRDFDQVVYMEDGRVKCVGTFDEVREKVEEFDQQASLLGI